MIRIIEERDVKKTRKPHRCFGCLKIIPVGSSAHVQVNDDMGIGRVYTHPTCEKIIKDMSFYYNWDELEERCVLDELDNLGFKGTPEEYIQQKGLQG